MAVFVWIFCGWGALIYETIKRPTWCGTPVWQEPTTYAMFFVTAILGPISWFSVLSD